MIVGLLKVSTKRILLLVTMFMLPNKVNKKTDLLLD